MVLPNQVEFTSRVTNLHAHETLLAILSLSYIRIPHTGRDDSASNK